METYNLNRYIDAQLRDYPNALSEIKAGKKQSHWMWYIFPQIRGLERTEISGYYAIKDLGEAKAYMQEPMLCSNMLEICEVLLALKTDDINKVLSFPDDMKLRSSMTLFAQACPDRDIFQKVLDKFYNGVADQKTLELLKEK